MNFPGFGMEQPRLYHHCRRCDLSFASNQALRTHRKKVHADEIAALSFAR